MTRKKVRLIKGPDRPKFSTVEGMTRVRIKNTFFCGECKKRAKTATTQHPTEAVVFICDKIDLHKSEKKHCWPFDNSVQFQ